MTGQYVHDDLAQVCRVLALHRMIDLWGHASLRMPKSDLVLVTPRFGRDCLPRYIRGEQMLVCDLQGNVIEGRGELPLQFAVDIALYQKNPRLGACIFVSPETAMAAGITRADLKPITHMESEIAYRIATWDSAALADSAAMAGELSKLIAGSGVTHQPGIGVWVGGKELSECLMTAYHLEYLAQANVIAARMDAELRMVVREDSDKLWTQFSGHHHYDEFFASLDPGAGSHPYHEYLAQHTPGREQFEELKATIAFSCRALWERGTLVAFLEHISHRLPVDNRFLMTAAKNYRDMDPQDITLLDYAANWISGPRPPGFKWFHAQIMAERRDVKAVVHTHDLYGRVYAAAQQALPPVHRLGLKIATRALPIYPRCDLIVDPDVRRSALDALGNGPVVHEAGHGTDFVATTLEQAVVDSIQREAFISMLHLAQHFGKPRPLPTGLIDAVLRHDPDSTDWWWFYSGEVGAPRRSAAGL